jgi:hypothetical protein
VKTLAWIRRRLAREEKGAVLVIVALWLALLFPFTIFVVDVGNWFAHQRHLQIQADAAAFAGGAAFQGCFGGGGDNALFAAASKYAGVAGTFNGTAYGSALYNPQVGNGNNGLVGALYQSKTYPPGTSGYPADDSQTTGPCTAPNMFDVKLTEADLPLFFSKLVTVNPHAHARVQLFTSTSDKPSIPLAPPDTNFGTTTVTFTNASGAELSGCSGSSLVTGTTCTFLLTSAGTCVVAPALVMKCGSVTVPVAAGSRVLMRVGLGSTAGTCAGTPGTAAYHCYGAESNTTGLYDFRGYAASGATIYGLTPTTMCAGNGSPFFSPIDTATTCSAGVSAWLPGTILANANIRASDNTNNNVPLVRCTNGADPLCHDTSGGRDAWFWSTTTNGFTIATGAGVDPIILKQQNTTLGTDQFYSGGNADNSGAIQLVRVTDSSGNKAGTLPAGNNTLTVNVGFSTYQVNAPCTGMSGATYRCATDPTIVMRSKIPGSSNTEAIDCAPGLNLRDQIINGCTNSYQVHPQPYTPICDPVTPPDCANTNGVGQGQSVGQIRQGMNTRWGNTCNNYPNYGGAPTPSCPTPATPDPRLILIILTDANAWGNGSGAGVQVPVVRFAAFYVTGWDGANGSGASTNEPFPGGASQLADIWGHFVKYVDTLGTPGTTPGCDPASPSPCVPALTK